MIDPVTGEETGLGEIFADVIDAGVELDSNTEVDVTVELVIAVDDERLVDVVTDGDGETEVDDSETEEPSVEAVADIDDEAKAIL